MKKNIREFVQKELPDFVNEVSGLSSQDLDARLAQLAKDIQAVDDAKDADEELQSLSDSLKVARGPYQDAKKVLRKKTSYIIDLLKNGA
jgi:hypothetical protein